MDVTLNYYVGRCRCCLSDGYLRSLGQEYKDDNGQSRFYGAMLASCLQIDIFPADGFPEDYLICEICILRLEGCMKFRNQISEAYKQFERLERDEWTYFDCDALLVKSYDVTQDEVDFFGEAREPSPCPSPASTIAASEPTAKIVYPKRFQWEQLWCEMEEKHRKSGEEKEKSAYLQAKGTVENSYSGRKYHGADKLPFRLQLGNLTCEICHETFYSALILSTHMNIHYQNFMCDKCGKGFANKRRLIVHMVSHTKGKYPCKVCGKIFEKYNSCSNHTKYAHGKMQYRCNICRMSFLEYYQRNKHLVTEHGMAERRFYCKNCPSNFARSSHLSQHVRRVHLGEKRVLCSICGYAVFSKSMLTIHMTKHGYGKPHKCLICNRSYRRRQALVYHMKKHNHQTANMNDYNNTQGTHMNFIDSNIM